MSKLFLIFIAVLILFFSGCSTRGTGVYQNYKQTGFDSTDCYSYGPVMDNKTHSHPTMRPYVVRGVKYFPTVVNVGDIFSGYASWYGPDFHGKLTSNGETYNMYDMTAAHKTLPMNTIVKVTNKTNGRTIVVRINDRGPFVDTRIIDLSKTAADKISMIGPGTAPVSLEVLGFQAWDTKNNQTPSRNFTPPVQVANIIQTVKTVQPSKHLGGFALQIASFSNIDGAMKVQEMHDKTNGYRTVIKDIEKENGRLFKVLLQGFKSEQEARDYLASGSFENAFIVKED